MKTSYYCLLFLSLALANTVISDEYECSHEDLPEEFFKLSKTHIKDSNKRTKNAGGNAAFNQPIRIFVHYNFTAHDGSLSQPSQDRVRAMMTALTKNFQSILTVRRSPNPILVNRQCENETLTDSSKPCFYQCADDARLCGVFDTPTEHLQRCFECNGNNNTCTETIRDGAGIQADLVLYVYGTTLFCGNHTIAYAGACQMEDEYDRPIVGVVNFCPLFIEGSSDDQFIFDVAKHEIFHVLGFGSNLYAWYRDENGNPRTPRDTNGNPPFDASGFGIPGESTIKIVNNTDWQTRNGPVSKIVTQLVTPKVVEVGRRHFGCDTLEGVHLEDQGGGGTVGSHWEKRLLDNEAMTGFISSNPVFSNFSYALLEDSGWYKVDYSNASILVWGRSDGCGYATGSCGGYIQSKRAQNEPITPFCDFLNDFLNPPNLSCDSDRTAVAFCSLITYPSPIPKEYQYLNSGANFNSSAALNFIGGLLTPADYCPYYISFSTISPNKMGLCKSGNPITENNELAETYGPRSRCVDHSGNWQITNGSNTYTAQYSAGCYEYQCSNSRVTIMILGQSYTCSRAGQVVQVNQTTNGITYRGGIVCPSCVEICYDDFENCPEAAELYGEFATTAPPTTTAPPDGVGNLLPMAGLFFIAIFISFAMY